MHVQEGNGFANLIVTVHPRIFDANRMISHLFSQEHYESVGCVDHVVRETNDGTQQRDREDAHHSGWRNTDLSVSAYLFISLCFCISRSL